jgi:hypothetical protein
MKTRRTESSSSDQFIKSLELELSQLKHVASFRPIIVVTGFALTLWRFVGMPLAIIGFLLNNTRVMRLGVFLGLVYVVLLLAGVVVMIPGMMRIRAEHARGAKDGQS